MNETPPPRMVYRPERRTDDVGDYRDGGPNRSSEFVGQAQGAQEPSRIFIEAARKRGRVRSITCCSLARPGLGKTTLAQIVGARELGVGFRATSGPVIAQGGRSRSTPHQS